MSTKVFSLVLDIKDELNLPLEQAPFAILEALSPIFAPRRVWLYVNDQHEIELSRTSKERFGEQELWIGERVDASDVITAFSPKDDGIIADARSALAPHTVRSVMMSAEGALRFRTRGASTPDWHGRWRLDDPRCLLDLVTVRFQWDEEARVVELSLSFSGYPLTSSELLGDGSLGHGEAHVAAANRELFFVTLGRVASAIGVAAGTGRWSDEGDYAPLFRDDADEIRTKWLPYLNEHNGGT